MGEGRLGESDEVYVRREKATSKQKRASSRVADGRGSQSKQSGSRDRRIEQATKPRVPTVVVNKGRFAAVQSPPLG